MNTKVHVLHPPPARSGDVETVWPSKAGSRASARRLQRTHAPLSFWLQWFALLIAIPACLAVAQMIVPPGAVAATTAAIPPKVLTVIVLALVLLNYPRAGVFRRLRRPLSAFAVATLVWLAVLAELAAIALFLGVNPLAHPVLFVWAGLVAVAQGGLIVGSAALFRFAHKSAAIQTPVVIVGTGPLAFNLLKALKKNPFLSDEVIGVVHERNFGGPASPIPHISSWVPDLGSVEDLPQLVQDYGIERVYLALPFDQMQDIRRIQVDLQMLNLDVVWAPDVTSVELLNPTIKELSGMPLLALSESPLSNVSSAYMKSLFDVVVAVCALVICGPLMIVAGIAVKLTSEGPIFYRQRRHGWDGTPFDIWKFRSMYLHTEEDGNVTQAKKDDDRITPVGRILRRTSMDELPQLFNVLNGTMSLVGPRPHALAHNLEYADKIQAYMSRHRIKPGITGLAQIHGLRGETETIDKMRLRVERDIQYINDWSILHDLWIVLRTPLALLRSRGAY